MDQQSEPEIKIYFRPYGYRATIGPQVLIEDSLEDLFRALTQMFATPGGRRVNE